LFPSTCHQPAGNFLPGKEGFRRRWDVKPRIEWGRVLCSLEGVLFVQVGSNSGMDLHDPVWHYATRCRWQGIALEPVNSTFQRLQNNYAPFPRVQPVRAAVSDRTGRSTRDGDGHRLERRGDTLRLERQGAEMAGR
jgi:hypothetical protein